MTDLALFLAVLFFFTLMSRHLENKPVTAPMIFVTAGILFGPGVFGLSQATPDSKVVHVLGEVALALLLFTDAIRIDPAILGKRPRLSLRLLGIGMPLTIAFGFLVALILFPGLTVWEAAIVATVLAPTDAALGQAVVTNERLPSRIRQALNIEAGLNDGLSVPFLTVFLALAEGHLQGSPGQFFLHTAVIQIGMGAISGAVVCGAGGWLIRIASKRGSISHHYGGLGVLALGLLAYAVAGITGGNGFIAAFVGGFVAGLTARDAGEKVAAFAEEQGQLLNLAVFYSLGVLSIPLLRDATWLTALYAVLSLTAIRILPVIASCAKLDLHRSSLLFLGWFGPRGLASIVLGLIVIEEAPLLAGSLEISRTIAATVLLSVFAHGITAEPLSRSYAKKLKTLPENSVEQRMIMAPNNTRNGQ